MSDENARDTPWPEIYRATVPGAWPEIYGMFVVTVYCLRPPNQHVDPADDHLHHGFALRGLPGQLLLIDQDTKTTVHVFAPPDDPFWSKIGPAIEAGAGMAQTQRRRAWGYTVEGLIAHYYHQRAAGGKLSLKQIAAQAGISYSYITKAKMKYDRAGKWGSGVNRSVKDRM